MRIPKRLQLPEFGKTGVPSRHRFSGAGLPGGHSEWEPPDPIPNSEVKLLSADDSVGSPHVKVGHCQAFHTNPAERSAGFFMDRCRKPFPLRGITFRCTECPREDPDPGAGRAGPSAFVCGPCR